MCEEIREALISLLNEEIKVVSWGVSNIIINDTSFEFCVSGFIFEGKVMVNLHESDYQVCFDNGDVIECSLNNLVDTLDLKIEKTSEYDTQIKEWLGNI